MDINPQASQPDATASLPFDCIKTQQTSYVLKFNSSPRVRGDLT